MKFEAFPGLRQLIYWVSHNESAIIQGLLNLAGEYASVGAVAGTIEEVHIFSTTLRTSDNKVVVVPNGKIIASEITNFSLHMSPLEQREKQQEFTQ